MTDYGLTHTDGGIDWTTTGGEAGGDKHGMNVTTNLNAAFLKEPYNSAWGALNGLALSCTDCHEPHGSPSYMLIRGEVNGAAVANITKGSIEDLQPLCQKCHVQASWVIHHTLSGNADAPYDVDFVTTQCADCHTGAGGDALSICTNCHFHGGDDSWLNTQTEDPLNGDLHYTGRRTF
jgi:hypothetical protein